MVSIDKKKCIGCGTCAAICEEVFEIKDDGKAHLKKGYNKKTPCIKEAIEACPEDAISL